MFDHSPLITWCQNGRLLVLQNRQRRIPSKKVYEDEHTFAFEDIDPKAPTHVLIVPKKHLPGLKEATRQMRRLSAVVISLRQK